MGFPYWISLCLCFWETDRFGDLLFIIILINTYSHFTVKSEPLKLWSFWAICSLSLFRPFLPFVLSFCHSAPLLPSVPSFQNGPNIWRSQLSFVRTFLSLLGAELVLWIWGFFRCGACHSQIFMRLGNLSPKFPFFFKGLCFESGDRRTFQGNNVSCNSDFKIWALTTAGHLKQHQARNLIYLNFY